MTQRGEEIVEKSEEKKVTLNKCGLLSKVPANVDTYVTHNHMIYLNFHLTWI